MLNMMGPAARGALCVIVTVFIVLLGGVYLYQNMGDKADTSVVSEGVTADGVDLSNMSVDEAAAAIDAYVAGLADEEIVLTDGSAAITVTAADLGLSCDSETIAETAAKYGKNGTIFDKMAERKEIEEGEADLDLALATDEESVEETLRANADTLAGATGSYTESGDNGFEVTTSNGWTLSAASVCQSVDAYLEAGWVDSPSIDVTQVVAAE